MNGTKVLKPLTDTEKRITTLIHPVSIIGEEDVLELGIGISVSKHCLLPKITFIYLFFICCLFPQADTDERDTAAEHPAVEQTPADETATELQTAEIPPDQPAPTTTSSEQTTHPQR